MSRGSKMPVSSAKKQNDDADEELLQVVARVTGGSQRIVQVADALGRFDVDRVLIAEGPLLHAQDEAELFDVLGQVGEGKGGAFVFVEVV